MEYIPVNIWDDYFDDGFVPEGEIQETYAYIEMGDDELSESDQAKVMSTLHDFIIALNLPNGLEVKLSGTTIDFKNITHVFREELVEYLQQANLEWQGIPIKVYSES